MGELGLGGGVEGEEDAGEIDAYGCAVGGGDVGAVDEVGGGGAGLEVCGPGERVEGLCGVEEVEESFLLLLLLFLLFGAGRGVSRRGWVVGLG